MEAKGQSIIKVAHTDTRQVTRLFANQTDPLPRSPLGCGQSHVAGWAPAPKWGLDVTDSAKSAAPGWAAGAPTLEAAKRAPQAAAMKNFQGGLDSEAERYHCTR